MVPPHRPTSSTLRDLGCHTLPMPRHGVSHGFAAPRLVDTTQELKLVASRRGVAKTVCDAGVKSRDDGVIFLVVIFYLKSASHLALVKSWV